MGGGKGGGTNTTTTSSAPPADVTAEYDKLVAQANQTAATPLQQYSGQLLAGLTPDQTSAINTVNSSQGISQPYINNAQQMVQNSTQPIWSQIQQFSPNAVSQYESPYTNQVLGAAEASENNQDAIQQEGVQGNAISSGAWGGDRSAVAQGIVAGQQALANNTTNTGILNNAYTQGLQEFNTQQQNQLGATEANDYLNAQGAFAESGLGTTAQNNALTGASAQLSAGQLEQQQDQSALNIPYEEFLQQQAYPFQTEGWLSNIAEGIGSGSGGTSSTSSPAPSTASQYAGLGLAAYSLFKKGGKIPTHYDDGGAVTGGIAPAGISTNPMQASSQQSYSNMSLEQLRQLATRIPPTSAQGQQLQKAIQQKTIMPNVGQQTQNGLSTSPGMARGGIAPRHLDTGGNSGDNPSDDVMTATGYSADSDPLPIEQNNKPQSFDDIMRHPIQSSDGPAPEIQVADNSSTPVPSGISTAPSSAPSNDNQPAGLSPQRQRAQPMYQPDTNQALMAAGLAIAGGTSPHALENIGQGGLKGLEYYEGQKKEAAQQSYQQGSLDESHDKLVQDTKKAQDDLAETHTKNMNDFDVQNQRNDIMAQQVAQGKYSPVHDGFGNVIGSIANTGPEGGHITPYDSSAGTGGAGSNISQIAQNIGIVPQPLRNKPDATNASKMISDSATNVGALNDSIASMQRIETLLPQIDQGKWAQAVRSIDSATGADGKLAALNDALPNGTPERAAYEEISKLEGNAALQNEVANGIKGRALGFNMVKLGQNLFASPEMSKDAQKNILDKGLLFANMAKNANEVTSSLEGTSPGTLSRAKEKYYNDSLAAGKAIPTQDYLDGSWKDKYQPTAQSAPAAPIAFPKNKNGGLDFSAPLGTD